MATTPLILPATTPAVVVAKRACTTCDCESHAGDGRYCERCGHDAVEHARAAFDVISAACTQCDCLTFRGGIHAAHCVRCGHPRALHSLDEVPEELPEGAAPRQIAVVATMLAAAGGGLVAWGLVLL
jgi:hypothetical protein